MVHFSHCLIFFGTVFISRFKRKAAGGRLSLASLINCSIIEKISTDLSDAIFVPVYKNLSKKHAANYRPIGMQKNLARLTEKYICQQFIKSLKKRKIFGEHIHGFWANHSCESQCYFYSRGFDCQHEKVGTLWSCATKEAAGRKRKQRMPPACQLVNFSMKSKDVLENPIMIH